MKQIKKQFGRILEISDDHKQITLPRWKILPTKW